MQPNVNVGRGTGVGLPHFRGVGTDWYVNLLCSSHIYTITVSDYMIEPPNLKSGVRRNGLFTVKLIPMVLVLAQKRSMYVRYKDVHTQ